MNEGRDEEQENGPAHDVGEVVEAEAHSLTLPFVTATEEEHAALEEIFPYGNSSGAWGTHLHPLVLRAVGQLHFSNWTIREWHRYFRGFSLREWGQRHANNEGRGSRWSCKEWMDYFRSYRHVYAMAVWTLMFLNITPNMAWELYRTQARWAKHDREEDSEEEKKNGGKGGPPSLL